MDLVFFHLCQPPQFIGPTLDKLGQRPLPLLRRRPVVSNRVEAEFHQYHFPRSKPLGIRHLRLHFLRILRLGRECRHMNGGEAFGWVVGEMKEEDFQFS